jgi:mono/diheme cytochrome c family protein
MTGSRSPDMRRNLIYIIVLLAGVTGAYLWGRQTGEQRYHHISGFAWSDREWAQRSRGIRTSYNPDHDLSTTELTLAPGDERWLDFVFWCVDNKVAEHQVEAYGGTEWQGPTGGVIFHWAPGSRWETHTLAGFGVAIGHVTGEHRWMDTNFPDFFEKYGGVYGINIKDRLAALDSASPRPWIEFLEYIGGAHSPNYRYLFHQEVLIDPIRERVYLTAGHGLGFEYSFERYYHELGMLLTDAKVYQFFQMYDLYGPGFASLGGWAKNRLSASLRKIYLTDDISKWATRPGVAKKVRYRPYMAPPPIPDGLPDADAVKRGEKVYTRQCVPCHGASGDGKGFLAASFGTKPTAFTTGVYKFRSTRAGELPALSDIEHTVTSGVANAVMPAWGQFLSGGEISDVAHYLAVFSDRFVQARRAGRNPAMLVIPPIPADFETLASRGKSMYERGGCAQCHGANGSGDARSVPALRDGTGVPPLVTELYCKWQFKNGCRPEDLYRTLFSGFNGLFMPAWGDRFPDERDRWALIEYVLSLSPKERPRLHLADYCSGVAEVGKRLDSNGLVQR